MVSQQQQVHDEGNLLWQEFDSISIEHCNRQANKVVHELARVANAIEVIMYLGQ